MTVRDLYPISLSIYLSFYLSLSLFDNIINPFSPRYRPRSPKRYRSYIEERFSQRPRESSNQNQRQQIAHQTGCVDWQRVCYQNYPRISERIGERDYQTVVYLPWDQRE